MFIIFAIYVFIVFELCDRMCSSDTQKDWLNETTTNVYVSMIETE